MWIWQLNRYDELNLINNFISCERKKEEEEIICNSLISTQCNCRTYLCFPLHSIQNKVPNETEAHDAFPISPQSKHLSFPGNDRINFRSFGSIILVLLSKLQAGNVLSWYGSWLGATGSVCLFEKSCCVCYLCVADCYTVFGVWSLTFGQLTISRNLRNKRREKRISIFEIDTQPGPSSIFKPIPVNWVFITAEHYDKLLNRIHGVLTTTIYNATMYLQVFWISFSNEKKTFLSLHDYLSTYVIHYTPSSSSSSLGLLLLLLSFFYFKLPVNNTPFRRLPSCLAYYFYFYWFKWASWCQASQEMVKMILPATSYSFHQEMMIV